MLNRNSIIVMIAFAAFIVSQTKLVSIIGPLEPNIFVLQLAFTPEQFWRVIELWGSEGVHRFQSHFIYDFLHPFVYGIFGYVCVRNTSLFSKFSNRTRNYFAYALPVAGICDLLENIIHVYLLKHGQGFGDGLIPIPGTAAAIKWSLAGVFTIALLLQCLRTLYFKLYPTS